MKPWRQIIHAPQCRGFLLLVVAGVVMVWAAERADEVVDRTAQASAAHPAAPVASRMRTRRASVHPIQPAPRELGAVAMAPSPIQERPDPRRDPEVSTPPLEPAEEDALSLDPAEEDVSPPEPAADRVELDPAEDGPPLEPVEADAPVPVGDAPVAASGRWAVDDG